MHTYAHLRTPTHTYAHLRTPQPPNSIQHHPTAPNYTPAQTRDHAQGPWRQVQGPSQVICVRVLVLDGSREVATEGRLEQSRVHVHHCADDGTGATCGPTCGHTYHRPKHQGERKKGLECSKLSANTKTHSSVKKQHTTAPTPFHSIPQHTTAYHSIPQHTTAYLHHRLLLETRCGPQWCTGSPCGVLL
jgi:hypothetical protein